MNTVGPLIINISDQSLEELGYVGNDTLPQQEEIFLFLNKPKGVC